MALTRKFLSALGIETDKVDEIINAHAETVDGLKNELAKAKADADKLPEVLRENEAHKKAEKENNGKNPFEVKYNAIKEEFAEYKKTIEAEKTKSSKLNAYRSLLKEAGVSERRIDAILRVSDSLIDGIELDDNGNAKDKNKLVDGIKAEWSDFIQTKKMVGANTANPPSNSGGTTKTLEDIYKTDEHGRLLLNATERQQARAELIVAQQQQKG